MFELITTPPFMPSDIIIVQVGLGIVLFFVLNWIGKHSYSIGYISLSVFARAEEAPAFNYALRILAPVIYLIITATVLYTLKLDRYVTAFYWVSIYYIGFRLLFNLLTGRGQLLNWYRQSLYWVSIILLSYLAYDKLIVSKVNILPDFTTVANELWIIIIVFLFHVANKIELPQEGTIRRKQNYLKSTFHKFKKQYGHIIDSKIKNDRLKALAYSILIYENFNRPKLARIIENLRFCITKKPHTLGVMQFYTDKMISDHESVLLGTEKILKAYRTKLVQYEANTENEIFYDWEIINDIISDYNSGPEYLSGVHELHTIIEETFFAGTQDRLLQPKKEDVNQD